MDRLAPKVAESFLRMEETRARIEKIPGWQESPFLRSLWHSSARLPLTEAQLATLTEMESES